MDTFKERIKKRQNRQAWFSIVLIILLVLTIISIVYLYKEEKRFNIVKLSCKECNLINISKSYGFDFFISKDKPFQLAEVGDVFMTFDDQIIYFNDINHDSIFIENSGKSFVLVNGKLNTLKISNKVNLLPWFQNMKEEEISHLETIEFTSKIPDNIVPYLKKIAQLKPNTSLVIIENDSYEVLDSYINKADFFNPLFVVISVNKDRIPLLSRWKKLECLYLMINDSTASITLPAMPSLKQCIVWGKINTSLFNNNRKLRKVVLNCDKVDWSMLQPLENLQELTVNTETTDLNLELLKNKFPKLSVLIISGKYKNIESLGAFKKLRWLGLPENTTQEQFDSLTSQLSDLQVLEIKGNDSIKNLRALERMPDLRGLIITDKLTDKKSLFTLKQLRYLSIPVENAQDSINILKLEKALPGCVVVPNDGACLGSGWLLLLLPLVLLFVYTYKSRLYQKAFPKNRRNGY